MNCMIRRTQQRRTNLYTTIIIWSLELRLVIRNRNRLTYNAGVTKYSICFTFAVTQFNYSHDTNSSRHYSSDSTGKRRPEYKAGEEGDRGFLIFKYVFR